LHREVAFTITPAEFSLFLLLVSMADRRRSTRAIPPHRLLEDHMATSGMDTLNPRTDVLSVALAALRNISTDVQRGISLLERVAPVGDQPLLRRQAAELVSSQPAPRPDDALAALSQEIGRRAATDPRLQAQLQGLMSEAIAAHASSASMLRMPNSNPGRGDGGGGGGPSSGGGSTAGSGAPAIAFPPLPVHYFWWGFNIELNEDAVRVLTASEGTSGIGAGLVSAIIGVLAAGAATGPAVIFFAAIAAYMAAEVGLILSVDRGNGVYLSMAWLAPGIIVPTTR
jgi:hypothetical protein